MNAYCYLKKLVNKRFFSSFVDSMQTERCTDVPI
jgi:hypothetical protein